MDLLVQAYVKSILWETLFLDQLDNFYPKIHFYIHFW